MNDKDALEETNAILEGKRKVQEGQYAVIKDTDTSKILYYKRTGDQWILDETMTDKELGDVFCNLRNKCLKINKKCLDENISKSQFNKKLLKQMMDHFDKEFYLSKDELREKLETEFKENASSISKLSLASVFVVSVSCASVFSKVCFLFFANLTFNLAIFFDIINSCGDIITPASLILSQSPPFFLYHLQAQS